MPSFPSSRTAVASSWCRADSESCPPSVGISARSSRIRRSRGPRSTRLCLRTSRLSRRARPNARAGHLPIRCRRSPSIPSLGSWPENSRRAESASTPSVQDGSGPTWAVAARAAASRSEAVRSSWGSFSRRMRPGDSTETGRESTGKRHGYEPRGTCRERGGIATLKTRFTELVGCTVPIQQAGMGDLAPPRLAAAVADAGALGMVGLTSAPLSYVVNSLDETRHLTSGVFGANFIYRGLVDESTGKVDPEFAGVVEAAASRARVVEFFYGTPDPALVEEVHAGGALVSWQVGSREEAIAAERARCDLIVAQGTEAGGHVRGKTGLLALLSEVLESVHAPVVAAGGIGSGRAMAASLAAGAAAVRVGTRFVAATEAEAHPAYLQK